MIEFSAFSITRRRSRCARARRRNSLRANACSTKSVELYHSPREPSCPESPGGSREALGRGGSPFVTGSRDAHWAARHQNFHASRRIRPSRLVHGMPSPVFTNTVLCPPVHCFKPCEPTLSDSSLTSAGETRVHRACARKLAAPFTLARHSTARELLDEEPGQHLRVEGDAPGHATADLAPRSAGD